MIRQSACPATTHSVEQLKESLAYIWGSETKSSFRSIAGSCHFPPEGYRKMTPEEILEIVQECF
ncbi:MULTISPECIES: hypothetical protein [Eubacteriales]|uniref:hypothetical protein n=1 Tax=Eubacteriales TaxID=186802 RepID=UPI0011073605|nr:MULTISPECIES: hypothetical protein [Eubacteriales]